MRQSQIVQYSTPAKRIRPVSIEDFNKLVKRVEELENKKEIKKPIKANKIKEIKE